MRKILSILMVAAALLSITACTNTAVETAGDPGFSDAVLDKDGNVVIDEAVITEQASLINYDAGGTTVQLIAVRASDGTVRLAYNTCQSCSPSPRAYFVQNGDLFTCQNCGTSFQTDDVGLAGFGCNPLTVTDAVEADGIITIPKESLEANAPRFAGWQGPVS